MFHFNRTVLRLAPDRLRQAPARDSFFLFCALSAAMVVALSSLTGARAQNQTPRILDWWETVDREHADRKNRLENLSSSFAAPRFHEYRMPRKEVAGSPVDIPVLRVVFQDRVFFDTAQWELRPDALKIIDTVAEAMRQDRPDVALFVAGHTDSRGTDEYNLDLSIKRATSVAEALLRRGAGVARIYRVGFGEAVPLRPNDSDANMALNRRVEFLFSSRPAALSAWLGTQMTELCADRSAAMAAHCRRFALEWRRYQATPISLSDLGGHVGSDPRVIESAGPHIVDLGFSGYGSLIVYDGSPYPIIGGTHVYDRDGLVRRLRPASFFAPIDLGGRQYFPAGFVSLPQSACMRMSDNGCVLEWRNVPTERGGSEQYCVSFCPRTPVFAGSGTPGGTIVVAGMSYPIFFGAHTSSSGGIPRRFHPASSLAAIYAGGHALYPTGYVATGAEVCRGATGNGCLLNWRAVPSLDGGADAQCVAYCPQPAAQGIDMGPVLPRPVDQGGAATGGCELYAFSSSGMAGTSLRTGSDFPTLGDWDKQISSLRVVAGKWSFFSGGAYSGDALELEPDSYPHLNNWTNQISSFRCDSRAGR